MNNFIGLVLRLGYTWLRGLDPIRFGWLDPVMGVCLYLGLQGGLEWGFGGALGGFGLGLGVVIGLVWGRGLGV
jgi:hypothetical protein